MDALLLEDNKNVNFYCWYGSGTYAVWKIKIKKKNFKKIGTINAVQKKSVQKGGRKEGERIDDS